MNYQYKGVDTLADAGELSKEAQICIQEWLQVNFVDNFGCEVEKTDSGGFTISDPNEEVGADDDAFSIHLINDNDNLSFIVVLLDWITQGIIFDVIAGKQVADVIEGDITDIIDGYEKQVKLVCEVVPINFNY